MLKAARRRNLRHIILNASAYHDKDIVAGAEYVNEQRAIPNGEWDVDRVLVVGEGVCIVAFTAACLASVINRRSQESRLVASSTPESLVDTRFHSFPLWQTLPLLGALLINAILRARQWQGKGRVWNVSEKYVGADLILEERMRKLEEEVASAVTIIRVLSKQLEKLGVRFRVTRQTLRDPIQETALLAEKTSQAVNILAAREDDLEKGLEELQQVLLGMQENQVKQLELISALGKLVRDRTVNRVDQPARGARKDNKRLPLKQDGRERDIPLQNRFVDKLGVFIGKSGNSQLSESQVSMQQRKGSRTGSDTPKSQGSSLQGLEHKENVSPPSSTLKHRIYGQDKNKVSTASNLIQNPHEKVDFWLNSTAPPAVALKSKEHQSTTEDSTRLDQFLSGRKSVPTNLGSKIDENVLHNDNGGLEGKSVHENILRPHTQGGHLNSEKLLESSTGEENFQKSSNNQDLTAD